MSVLVCAEPSGSEVATEVTAPQYARLLELPRNRPLDQPLVERAQAARSWYASHGRPWVAARRDAIARLDASSIAVESGSVFHSGVLSERLRAGEAHGLMALAVSAGPEADAEAQRLWAEDRPDEAYFLDRFAAAVAEQLVCWASVWFCRRAEAGGETVLAHLSPGCGDWDLKDQAKLMRLIAAGSDAVGPVRMLSSGMLRPKNSLLAVRGLTRRAVLASPADACRSCDLSPCRFRRAAYRGAA